MFNITFVFPFWGQTLSKSFEEGNSFWYDMNGIFSIWISFFSFKPKNRLEKKNYYVLRAYILKSLVSASSRDLLVKKSCIFPNPMPR